MKGCAELEEVLNRLLIAMILINGGLLPGMIFNGLVNRSLPHGWSLFLILTALLMLLVGDIFVWVNARRYRRALKLVKAEQAIEREIIVEKNAQKWIEDQLINPLTYLATVAESNPDETARYVCAFFGDRESMPALGQPSIVRSAQLFRDQKDQQLKALALESGILVVRNRV